MGVGVMETQPVTEYLSENSAEERRIISIRIVGSNPTLPTKNKECYPNIDNG